MTSRVVLLLATVCGLAVGNVYFPQAITPAIAAGLHVAPDAATAVLTAAQFGYTLGLFLLVPLGDRVPHRRLLGTLLLLTATTLAAAACAPALPPLIALSLLIGTTTVVAPIIGPMVAGLVPAARRGVTTGLLLSGSTAGMLLARTFSGYLATWWSWRVPYFVAATLILLMTALLTRHLPPTRPTTTQPYRALIVSPLRLLVSSPELRRSCLNQATIFAAFSATWASIALLLTGPGYGYDARAVGLLALVNAATMIATPLAGRLIDRHGPNAINRICAIAVIAAAVLLAMNTLPLLIAGTLLLDIAMQSGMVANQVRIYAIGDSARARLNTAYMTCAYLGGAVGSWLGVHLFTAYGWGALCAFVAALALPSSLVIHVAATVSAGQEPL